MNLMHKAREHTLDLKDKALELKRCDDRRRGFPGEHWLVLGAGILLLVFASRRGSPLVRSVATTLGTGFIGRAASGRDGVRKLARSRVG